MNARNSPFVTGRDASANGSQESAVARRFVVEGEAVAVVADLDAARRRCAIQLRLARAHRRQRPRRQVGGPRGLHDSRCLTSVRISSWCCCSWCRPSSISAARSRATVAASSAPHRARRRARGSASTSSSEGRESRPRCGARMLVADGVVVGVEQHRTRVEGRVAGSVRREHERLEEPRRVREVPLGRARVGHRLHDAVLGRQRRRERERLRADVARSVARAARRVGLLAGRSEVA